MHKICDNNDDGDDDDNVFVYHCKILLQRTANWHRVGTLLLQYFDVHIVNRFGLDTYFIHTECLKLLVIKYI